MTAFAAPPAPLDTLTSAELREYDHTIAARLRYSLTVLEAVKAGRSYAETAGGITDLWWTGPDKIPYLEADVEEYRAARRALRPYRDPQTSALRGIDDPL